MAGSSAFPGITCRGSAPLFLGGPTATGKSQLALLLAERLAGEIVSVDSMQVYQGLDIGTAKPSAAERARVRHHLIDVIGLQDPFDVAQFVKLARAAVADIQSRGRLPIFCGGTGLYFKAFLEGLGESPAVDRGLRAELEQQPLASLLEELARRDPETFARIDRQNPRRVVRAIEVIRLTGRPFSEQRAPWPGVQLATSAPTGFYALSRSPHELHRRIETRVDAMFQSGLVEETRELLRQGLAQNKTASQALGYRQVIEHVEGARGLPETIELVKARTRQYAKRQLTWFRRQLSPIWVQLQPGQEVGSVADFILESFRHKNQLAQP